MWCNNNAMVQQMPAYIVHINTTVFVQNHVYVTARASQIKIANCTSALGALHTAFVWIMYTRRDTIFFCSNFCDFKMNNCNTHWNINTINGQFYRLWHYICTPKQFSVWQTFFYYQSHFIRKHMCEEAHCKEKRLQHRQRIHVFEVSEKYTKNHFEWSFPSDFGDFIFALHIWNRGIKKNEFQNTRVLLWTHYSVDTHTHITVLLIIQRLCVGSHWTTKSPFAYFWVVLNEQYFYAQNHTLKFVELILLSFWVYVNR